MESVCLRSMLINLQPDKVYLHANVYGGIQDLGEHFMSLYGDKSLQLAKKLRMKLGKDPSEIQLFGLTSVKDVEIIELYQKFFVLRLHGGIYADTNILITAPLQAIRSKETTIVHFGNDSNILDKGLLMASERDSSLCNTVIDRTILPIEDFKTDLEQLLASSSLHHSHKGAYASGDWDDDVIAVKLDEQSMQLSKEDLTNMQANEEGLWWTGKIQNMTQN